MCRFFLPSFPRFYYFSISFVVDQNFFYSSVFFLRSFPSFAWLCSCVVNNASIFILLDTLVFCCTLLLPYCCLSLEFHASGSFRSAAGCVCFRTSVLLYNFWLWYFTFIVRLLLKVVLIVEKKLVLSGDNREIRSLPVVYCCLIAEFRCKRSNINLRDFY